MRLFSFLCYTARMAVLRRRTQAVVEPVAAVREEEIEVNLRPKTLLEYIGQPKVKEHLSIHMGAAKSRSEPLGHTLLHGPPGLGKTTLAYIIAAEMGAQVRITSGPVIEKSGDLASILTNLQRNDVLFIDEIHRLRPNVEEVLYSAMEDCVLDIMIGKGPTARSIRLNLQPFTLVGATTKAGAMSSPLRDRFLHTFKLGFYEQADMEKIVERSAAILNVALHDETASIVAAASRATPRIANRLVRSVRDFAQVNSDRFVTSDCARFTLRSLDIDPDGLDAMDRAILRTIITSFSGGPVGLSTLAAMLAEEEETIEDVYEPYLLQQGYLQRTPKGRIVTPKAYAKTGMQVPDGSSHPRLL